MQKSEVIRSLYSDQFKILEAIIQLHLQEKTFEVDVTYGNGGFYKKGIPQPTHRFDIDDKLENITKACNSNNTELKAASVNSVIFDPPFLTYIRKQRTGNSSMVMSRRFSGYWSSDELTEHYKTTIEEENIEELQRQKSIIEILLSKDEALYLLNKVEEKYVPVTHKDMTRFNITLDESVDFVIKSFNIMRGSEIFVPKIPSYRILDLVKAINPKFKIKLIGIRIYEIGISYYGRDYSLGKKINWKDGIAAIWCIFKYNLFYSDKK